ncbi:IS1634 family transposase [Candidatus Methanoperedens nitratireducens]|nr:transposase [Candidatus Methanoperedens nitroreducens]
MSFIKKIKKKGKTYAIEVEGYRDKDGKVKHKYLRYLGTLDENGKVKSSQKAITVDKVFRFGLPAIVSKTIEQLKLKDMIEKYKEDLDTILLMHLCAPSSISKMGHQIENIDPDFIKAELPFNRKRIDATLDFLEEHKEVIEQNVYENLKEKYSNETLFYDITSIALNGYRSTLAKIGYPEFSPQINIGLCIEGKYGFPIFHEIFSGNFPQKKTLFQIAEKLKVFGRTNAVLIFDAGIADVKTIADVEDLGFGVISRMPMHEGLKKIVLENLSSSVKDIVKLSGSKVYVKEIQKEKGKLLICFNEKLKVSIKEHRYDEVIEAIEKKKKGKPIKDGLKKYLLKNGKEWKIDYDKLEEAEKYDGIYVIYCSDTSMPKEKAVKAYFERDRIEKGFQTMKNVLNVKPLRFQLDKKIRAFVMLCHLAYLVATYIEAELKDKELNYSFDKIKELLENVYTVKIHHGDKLLKRTSSMTEEQKKIMDVFGCCHNQG